MPENEIDAGNETAFDQLEAAVDFFRCVSQTVTLFESSNVFILEEIHGPARVQTAQSEVLVVS